MFGISAILGRDATGHAPCGCGDCDENLEIEMLPGQPVNSEWLAHFVVPASRFWEKIGFT